MWGSLRSALIQPSVISGEDMVTQILPPPHPAVHYEKPKCVKVTWGSVISERAWQDNDGSLGSILKTAFLTYANFAWKFCIVIANLKKALAGSEPCSLLFCPIYSLNTSFRLERKVGGQGRPCIQGDSSVVSQKRSGKGWKWVLSV